MTISGRPRTFDVETALAGVARLFWERGYAGTSLNHVCRVLKLNKASIYAAFGNKESLYARALEWYFRKAEAGCWEALRAAPTARQGVEAFLRASADFFLDKRHPPGCMATLSDLAPQGHAALRRRVRSFRQESLARIKDRLIHDETVGKLPIPQLEGVARTLLCVQQGMSVQARDGARRQELETVIGTVMRSWQILVS
jgi:AcrR family transcriptional regulator